ncbi:MAG: cysteine--tRNA ligase [Thermoprotei archaeon]|nr:MAG: cysteine--tRNA ligase [Thermoprotei archaeon]
MTIRVYNTLSKSLENFEPFNPPKVGMYVCGPTVYDYTHVGHARTYVAFDVIKRFLNLKGFEVTYVQNITDIDDKIINRANKENVDWKIIADTYTKDYLEALEKLHIEVDVHPKATHHIKEMIDFISKLIEAGFAYESNGSVYFDVDKFLEYGKLSKRVKGEGWRQEEAFIHEKKRPYDFALWKRAKPGEPWWESPWGPGRPGWHIECSVMSSFYLGDRIDIHGGGVDLVFPHHENEIAQSEARYGVKPWVKYWLHAGYLTIKGEKMSKSLGNIIPLKEIFTKHKPEALRLMLALTHYRSTVDFSYELLERYERIYERLKNCVELLMRITSKVSFNFKLSDEELKIARNIDENLLGFITSMEDDFNGAKAAPYLHNIISIAYSDIIPSEKAELALKALNAFKRINQVLAVLDDVLGARSFERNIIDKLVQLIVDIRQIHRSRKEYEIADKIREQLASLGIKLMDSKTGTTWTYT